LRTIHTLTSGIEEKVDYYQEDEVGARILLVGDTKLNPSIKAGSPVNTPSR
jgi:hypothetical protein